jgi:hypothetical protein
MRFIDPRCENCQAMHGYQAYEKVSDHLIRWFCGTRCKKEFFCEDTSSLREFMATGGFA